MNDQVAVRLLTFTLTVLILAPGTTRAQPTTAAEIRASFRQQGFKTDLSDFDFTVPKEMADRGAALTNMMLLRPVRPASALDDTDLLTPVTNDTAMVVWKQKSLAKPKLRFDGFFSQYEPGFETNIWPVEHDLLEQAAPELDSATAAVLSGSFGYDLNAAAGLRMLLPHLRSLKNLGDMFAGRTVLALHDHDSNMAWTNLLALTRLVTGWQVEPVEVSQNTRFGSLKTAYDVTWQALQAGDWPDARLTQLQHEWESLDVFKPLPDTVAFMTASYIAAVQKDDDSSAVEDEKALLLSGHNRELEMRRAIQSPSWAQMQLIADVTNRFFVFPSDTNLPPAIRRGFYMTRATAARSGGYESLAGRASEAEARRRLIITAIALERFRSQRGSYPNSLDALTPEFLKTSLPDFMNGQPLHYSLRDGGHFLLYSVGLDGEDNGGKIPQISDQPRLPMRLAQQQDTDIVWPLPASSGEVSAHFVEMDNQEKQRNGAIELREANEEAQAEIARQAAVKDLLSNPKYQKTTWTKTSRTNDEPIAGELTCNGQPLAKLLTNEKSSGTNALSPDALFTLKPVHSDEPGYAYFQLPIAYDRLTNLDHPTLGLIMDTSDIHEIHRPQVQGYVRATNGDCLLVWNTTFDRPGLHALQADLYVNDGDDFTHVTGPVIPYSSTNICWFDRFFSQFDDHGAELYARLVESNATFSIEVQSETGQHLKTFNGSTTNALINLKWNLLDDYGSKVTNKNFIATFTITLTDSGRTQTLKQ